MNGSAIPSNFLLLCRRNSSKKSITMITPPVAPPTIAPIGALLCPLLAELVAELNPPGFDELELDDDELDMVVGVPPVTVATRAGGF